MKKNKIISAIYFVCLMFCSFSTKASGPLPVVNQMLVQNKLNSFKLHQVQAGYPAFNNFLYQIVPITDSAYQLQKPSSAMNFDAGYVSNVGNFYTIYVSTPTSPAQIAAFANDDKAVLFYLSQAYLSFYYQTNQMPIWFKCGFAAYEAGLIFSDSTIKVALNNYGGSITSFNVLNDTANFRINNGLAVSYMFGEYMGTYKTWSYRDIWQLTSTSISVTPWWYGVNTLQKFLYLWNQYLNIRIIQATESLRVKLNIENNHFRCYFRDTDNYCFPDFINTLDSAYTEYSGLLNTQAYEKLTYFTLPECLGAAFLDSVYPCPNRVTGGTAWSSGLLTTCANNISEISIFLPLLRHELAHTFAGLLDNGYMTAWTNEGFPGFFEGGIITPSKLTQLRPDAITRMNNAIAYFGHKPTYAETAIYPYPDYGYYVMGYFWMDFIYRSGGYQAIKNIVQHDTLGFQTLGYSTPEAIMKAFYYDFDTRVKNLPVVTVLNPNTDSIINTTTIPLLWVPLDSTVALNVDVSIQNDSSWVNIISHTTQHLGIWNTGGYYGQFWLKFTAPDNLNVSNVYGPFLSADPSVLTLVKPNIKKIFVAGDTILIKWANSNIPSINIQYTLNNGSSWTTIGSNIATSGLSKKWVIVDTASTQCRIRIVNATNSLVYDESDSLFTIVHKNNIGGPYSIDSNTILLLHFNNDLINESSLTGPAIGVTSEITYQNSFDANLGTALKSISALTVAHNNWLNLTGDWTIETWIKLAAFPSGYKYFINKPGTSDPYLSNYSLQVNPYWSNVFFGFYFADTNTRIGTTSITPQLNTWYHIALIRDTQNGELRFLVHDSDRNLISTTTQAFTNTGILLNINNLKIADGISCYMDELRISNIVRTFQNNTTSIPETNTTDKSISVYPNPANFEVSVYFPQGINANTNIELYNMVGQLIQTTEITSVNGNTLILQVSSLHESIYILNISNGKEVVTRKLSVVH